jgi:hypothetical protein
VLVRLDHVASFIVNATSEAVEQQRLPWRGLSPGTWMLANGKAFFFSALCYSKAAF